MVTKYKKGIWTTNDGKEIKIKDLKDSHLLNIQRMLRQHIENEKHYLGVLGTMWEPRGEMAQEAFDQEFEQQMELAQTARIWLRKIDPEIKKRNLKEQPLKEPYKPMPKMVLVEDLGYGRIYKKADETS